MLRNSYIEQYCPKSTKAKFIEHEMALIQTDLNKLIFSQRPLSTKTISKLPKNNFPTFIDDIMCNHDLNTLLYSSNATKEMNFYLKQKNSLLIRSPDNDKYKKKKKLSQLGEIMLNRNNIQMVNSLKDRIKEFLIKRKQMYEDYKDKQDNFERIQPNLEIKLKKLYFKPMNEIRLEGFKRAYKKCLKKSRSDNSFELPNIKFNIEDVYSRLSHNVILDRKTLQEKEIKEKEKKEKEENNNTNNFNSYNTMRQSQIQKFNHIPNTKLEKLINNNSNRHIHKRNIVIKSKKDTINNDSKLSDLNIDINDYNYYYQLKNMPPLNISKILKCSAGKEFKIKITPRITKRCLSVLSCGPKPRSPRNLTSEKKDTENEEEKIDYKELRNKSIYNINDSKSKRNINNLILYNTLKVGQNSPTNDIVKIRNYRDQNFNSNLHISVLNNSYKLVEYFLNKKLNPNAVNKDGRTPLHLAMKKGNIDIIELLIKNGASREFKDKKGKIPIDYASKKIKHYFIFENPK